MNCRSLRSLDSKTNEDLVSVVIPTFNRRDLVREAIESVVKQTWPYLEIILVDDGSTDGTLDDIKHVTTQSGDYTRDLRTFYQPNSGVAAARNRGLKEVKGSLILFLDSDDLLDPDAIAQMITAMRAEKADMALAYVRSIEMGSSRLVDDESGTPLFEHASRRSHWFTHSALYHRDLVERAGPFCETLDGGEELEYHWRIARITRRVATLDQIVGSRRHHQFGHLSVGIGLSDYARTILSANITHDQWLADNGFEPSPFRWRDWLVLVIIGTRLGADEDWQNKDHASRLIGGKVPKSHPVNRLSRAHFFPRWGPYYRFGVVILDVARWVRARTARH